MMEEFRELARRFASERVAPLVRACGGDGCLDELRKALDEALGLGFAHDELGIWGRNSLEEGALGSVLMLEEFAIEHAGFALCLHAKGILSLLREAPPDECAVCMEGVVLAVDRPHYVVALGEALTMHKAPSLCELVPRTGLALVSLYRLEGGEIQALVDGKVMLAAHLLGLTAVALGNAKGALRDAVTYASQRLQGGRPIKEYGAVKRLLGGAHCRVSTVELGLRCAAVEFPKTSLPSLWGLWNTSRQLLLEAVSDCLQVFGGYGYMEDYGMERRLRDAMTLRGLPPSVVRLEAMLAEGGQR